MNAELVPVLFQEVRVTSVADALVLLLREADGGRVLPIWVSAAGANAILSTTTTPDLAHPSTHDLLLDALGVVDATIEQARIIGVSDGVFSAMIVVNGMLTPARASDAVALALRSGAQIMVVSEVMDAVAVAVAGVAIDNSLMAGPDAQLERFRAFLDSINPDDFGGASGEV